MAKHDKTLHDIFEIPTKASIDWRDVEALFKHLGATVKTAKGSRVRVMLNGIKATLHRSHPRKEATKGCVESVRKFLENAGIEP